MGLLAVEGLTKSFRRNGQPLSAVDDVSFELGAGETLGLVGPSGSGKSSIGRLILRLIEPDAGRIEFDGADFLMPKGAALRRARRAIQMVFQDPLAAFDPRVSVRQALADPLRVHAIGPAAGRDKAIATLLDRVGLESALAGRAIHEISGGQRQRIAIARALATEPKLIVLDEALSALDVSVRGQILELLVGLQRDTGVSYLFISHDLALVRVMAHRIAILDAGRIVETGPARAVVDSPQSATGKALVAAIPNLAREMT